MTRGLGALVVASILCAAGVTAVGARLARPGPTAPPAPPAPPAAPSTPVAAAIDSVAKSAPSLAGPGSAFDRAFRESFVRAAVPACAATARDATQRAGRVVDGGRIDALCSCVFAELVPTLTTTQLVQLAELAKAHAPLPNEVEERRRGAMQTCTGRRAL